MDFAEGLRMRLFALLLLWPSVAMGSANFVGAPEVYLQRAEECRHQIAVWWIGKPLPKWYEPCQMTVKVRPTKGGGLTTFRFDRGEVFGWRMEVDGPHEWLMEDVIPHEVNHTILASLVRRPLTRWLDEGACQQFESRAHIAEQRQYAARYSGHQGSAWSRLDAMEYPRDGESVMAMYATGCAVVEWLLQMRGKEVLLAFIRDTRPPSQKFASHYGMPPQQARQQWVAWLQGGGAPQATGPPSGSQPVVWVLTAEWCGSCQRLKQEIAAGKYPGIVFQFANVDTPAGKAKVADVQRATGRQVKSLPTLWQEGTRVMYPPENSGNQPPTVWEWFKFTLRLPLTLVEELTGDRPQPRPPSPEFGVPPTSIPGPSTPQDFIEFPPPSDAPFPDEPTPFQPTSEPIADSDPEPDFTGARLLLFAPRKLSSDTAANALLSLSRAATSQVREATDGKAQAIVISERQNPEQYAAACEATGVTPGEFAGIVMVPAQSHGARATVRGFMARVVRERLPAAVRDAPVGLLTEVGSPKEYAATIDALAIQSQPATQDPVEGGDPVPDSPITLALAAILGAIRRLFGGRS